MAEASPSKLRRLAASQRQKFEGVVRNGLLGADAALGEEFFRRFDALLQTDKSDREIYAELAAFRAQNLARFEVCRDASNVRRLQSRLSVVKDIIPEGCVPQHILDVGCGDGYITDGLSEIFTKAGGKMYGIDITPPSPGHHEFQFMPYDAKGNIPAPNKSFDFAILLMVLHHVPEPEKVLMEIARVLEPGGYLLVRETNADNDERQLFNTVMDEIFYTVLDDNEYLAFNTKFRDLETWKDIFNRSGLNIVRIDNREKENAFTPNWFLLTRTEKPKITPR